MQENVELLKSIYEKLRTNEFSTHDELVNFVNLHQDEFLNCTLIHDDGIDYTMTNSHGDIYTITWTQSYQMYMAVEDVVCAIQILNGIEIDGVHNTYDLIDKINGIEKNYEMSL